MEESCWLSRIAGIAGGVLCFSLAALAGGKGDFVCTQEGKVTLAVEQTYTTAACEEALAQLKSDIVAWQKAWPSAVTDAFRQDTVWVEAADFTIEYVGNALESGRAACVVVGNLADYAAAVAANQPQLLVNRVAQLYFDRYMPQEKKLAVYQAYAQGRSEQYGSVYASNGVKLLRDRVPDAQRSVTLYFAELSEAYWGENDFYPFDYEELERYDPRGFAALQSVYGARVLEPNVHGISLPPDTLTQWLAGKESPLDPYYRKYLDAGGLPVLASRFVRDEALVQASYIVRTMLSRIPEAKAAMQRSHFRVGVVGVNENITDMPENRMMNVWWPETDWDARGRGYGATEMIPLMTCGEENIVEIPGYRERYLHESIMVHEFAHNVDYGLRRAYPDFEPKLLEAFRQARAEGLWAGTYSMSNSAEYFAEGVQAWFNTCNMYVRIGGQRVRIHTREQLREYDPRLYELLATVMPAEYLTGYHFEDIPSSSPVVVQEAEEREWTFSVERGRISLKGDAAGCHIVSASGVSVRPDSPLSAGFYWISCRGESRGVWVP
ncbi:MAG: hypothetical protein ACOYJE_10235 [Bacteroidaceae bacterium]|jgi:hypothetical protein